MACSWRAAVVAALLAAPGAAGQTGGEIEKRAEAAFASNDCNTALREYRALAALDGVPAAKLGLVWRRIGICENRANRWQAAADAYRTGIERSQAAGDLDMMAENLHGVSLALMRMSRYEESLEYARRQLEIVEKCGHGDHLVRGLVMEAMIHANLGNTRRAIELYERALPIARQSKSQYGVISILQNTAPLYAGVGEIELGLRYTREVIALTDPTDQVTLGALQNNLGAMLRGYRRYAEAQVAFEAAILYTDRPEMWRGRAPALFNMHLNLRDLGKTEQAMERLEEFLRISREHSQPDETSRGLEGLASLLIAMGRTERAEPAAREAVEIARRIGSPLRLYEGLATLGLALSELGRAGEAREALEEAAAIVEAQRSVEPGDAVAQQTSWNKRTAVFQILVRNAIRTGTAAESLRWAERSKARVLNGILLAGGANETRLMTEEEARRERELDRAVLRAGADSASARRAMTELALFRRQLYSRHPEIALRRADFTPAGPEQLAELLPDAQTALVDYFFVHNGLALFIVRKSGIKVHVLPMTEAGAEGEVERFRKQLAGRDINYRATARMLYDALLGKAAADLRGANRWILSPDGPLWALPFQALLTPAGAHLGETHTVAYAPSLTAGYEIHRRGAAPGRAELALAAFGHPLSAALSPAQTEAEVREIGRFYPAARSVVATGAAARADRFRSEAPRARVLHVATHAEFDNLHPLEGLLRLAGGEVTARDILRLPLRADLAVLSACETALGASSRGEGMMGMGWALTAAGARASVVSLWKVESESTRSLMVAFHRRLARGDSKAAALRNAALEVSRMPGYRHPFYWAGFLVVGDGLRPLSQ